MSAPASFESYLETLRRGLRFYPGRREDVVDEVRDHLLSARERALGTGRSDGEAEREALAAMGDARALARRLVAEKRGPRLRLLVPCALVAGLFIAYVDSRPTWDDAGVSAAAVLGASGLLGLLEPTRPWMWALSIGAWIPLVQIASHHNGAALLALLIAAAGAQAGSWARRLAAS